MDILGVSKGNLYAYTIVILQHNILLHNIMYNMNCVSCVCVIAFCIWKHIVSSHHLPFNTYSDKDECAIVPSVCHSDADCTDSDGSYECTCKGGYSGNGIFCTGTIYIFFKNVGLRYQFALIMLLLQMSMSV